MLDRHILAERAAVLRRHLDRVAEKLPAEPDSLQPATDASDAVILHLWQAVQITIDTAVSACLAFDLGAPSTYGNAFERLAKAGILDTELGQHLRRAAGFRNVIAHAYEGLDMARVEVAARSGPAHLLAFFRALRDRLNEA